MSAELLHFSEDPGVRTFVPRVAPTAAESEPLVWAVDVGQAPAYWFPRDCPRVAAWIEPTTTPADLDRVLGGASRVHAIEHGWLRRLQTARLYLYRFDGSPFRAYGDPPYAFVADRPVDPVGPPEALGDLLALHEQAGIELRLVADLARWVERVVRSTCGFSAIRMGNARSSVEGSWP